MLVMRLPFIFIVALGLSAQTNPLCPGATGPTPHCTVLSWTAPTSGASPTSYNAYRSTATGVCTWAASTTGPITPPTGCVKVGSVNAPTLTVTDNSSPSNILTEGATYFYVVTSADALGESAPSVEASAKIPVLPTSSPTGTTAVPH